MQKTKTIAHFMDLSNLSGYTTWFDKKIFYKYMRVVMHLFYDL